jgi:hypothetical protein
MLDHPRRECPDSDESQAARDPVAVASVLKTLQRGAHETHDDEEK